MVMIANKKTKDQMANDLNLFLGKNSLIFTDWIHGVLERLQSISQKSAKQKDTSGGAESIKEKKASSSKSEKSSKKDCKTADHGKRSEKLLDDKLDDDETRKSKASKPPVTKDDKEKSSIKKHQEKSEKREKSSSRHRRIEYIEEEETKVVSKKPEVFDEDILDTNISYTGGGKMCFNNFINIKISFNIVYRCCRSGNSQACKIAGQENQQKLVIIENRKGETYAQKRTPQTFRGTETKG